MQECQQQHEVNNYCNDNYDPSSEQIGKLRDSAKWIEEFKCTLLSPHSLGNQDSFYCAIICTIHYQLKNKKDECQNEKQLKEKLGNLHDALLNLKENLRLDLNIQNFENQCHSVNELLNKNGLFLRINKLKEKFRYLIKQNSEKKTVLRELSTTTFIIFWDFLIF